MSTGETINAVKVLIDPLIKIEVKVKSVAFWNIMRKIMEVLEVIH